MHAALLAQPLPDEFPPHYQVTVAIWALRNMPGFGLSSLLTDTDICVLDGICRGLTNTEIGRACGIHTHTVQTHIAAIGRAFGVRGRLQIAIYAFQRGWARPGIARDEMGGQDA